MSDFISPLIDRFGDKLSGVPYAIDYFAQIEKRPLVGDEFSDVRCLPPSECIECMDDLEHPMFDTPEFLDTLLLDDGNTSDHHCLAFDLPLPGCVIFVPHGDSVKIVFRNLVEFAKAAETAIETNTSLTDYHRVITTSYHDQRRLEAAIEQLLSNGDVDEVLCLLAQTYDLGDKELVNRMIDADMYLAASVAERIAAKPRREFLQYAQRCADSHVCWRSGIRALAAVKAILPERR